MYGSNRCREKNPRWIEGVPKNKFTLHRRVWTLYGKADRCENPKCKGKSQDFDWSNKKHDYKSINREDWQMLCVSCHRLYDYSLTKKETNNVI